MAISYDSLRRTIYQLFGECSTERDFFSNNVWLYIRRNNYAFVLRFAGMIEFKEIMDDLRDIYISVKMFEAGDVVFG